jgi:putative hydrolase of the HAD superfamily
MDILQSYGIDPARIRAVFLDAGNTLIFLDFETIADIIVESGPRIQLQALEQAEHQARRKADQKYRDGAFRDSAMWKLYFTWILESVGVPDDRIPETLLRLRERSEQVNFWNRTRPEIAPALAEIKESGRRLAVISNSDGSCHSILRQLDLLPYFDKVYDSAVVGVEKPDVTIFQKALNELDVEPEETLHVGDLESVDVLGARRAGIHAILVDPERDSTGSDFPILKSVAELPRALGIEPSNQFKTTWSQR